MENKVPRHMSFNFKSKAADEAAKIVKRTKNFILVPFDSNEALKTNKRFLQSYRFKWGNFNLDMTKLVLKNCFVN